MLKSEQLIGTVSMRFCKISCIAALLCWTLSGCGLSTEAPLSDASDGSQNQAPVSAVEPSTKIVVSAIDPPVGVLTGNVFVTVSGQGFTEGMEVRFGEIPAENIRVVNDQFITLTTPELPPGIVDVSLTIPGSESIISKDAYLSISTSCVDPTDSDGDGLTDCEEKLGQEIRVDRAGFDVDARFVQVFIVTSDPLNEDTDGDGVLDRDEFLSRSNPRLGDTDGDGLGDWEEINRWLTAPMSVDTDGDARGPNGDLPPNPSLFDGAELNTTGYEVPQDIFISEYVEGSSGLNSDVESFNNRAIELYNPTDRDIDLFASGYRFEVYNTAGTIVGISSMSGIIPAGGVYIVADELSNIPVNVVDEYTPYFKFDGNQIITLVRNSMFGDEVLDSIGQLNPVRDINPPLLDQSTVAGAIDSFDVPLDVDHWQSFTAGVTGQLTKMQVVVGSPNLPVFIETTVTVDLLAGEGLSGPLLGTVDLTTFFVKAEQFPMDAAMVAGQKYTVVFRATPDAVTKSLGANYDAGGSDISPDEDLWVVTTVAASAPGFGKGDTNTVDHTLVRKVGICSGDTDINDRFDPADEWRGYPIDTFSQLGSHISICPQRVVAGGTSPTLADTDGDGKTDYEEFDDAVRSPVIAELPKLELDIDGEIDIFLNVEYADSLGKTEQYGTSVSETNQVTVGSYASNSISHTISASSSIGFNSKGATGDFTAGYSLGLEETYGTSRDSSQALQKEFSRSQTESQQRTESFASGTIRVPLRLTNISDLSFSVTNLGLTVKQPLPLQDPTDERVFQPITTLVPDLSSFTLAPGEETPIVIVERTDVDPDKIRELMAKPSSFLLEPAYYDLSNAGGIDFDFLKETTFARTAHITIDFGDGRADDYFIATNVNRNFHNSGYAGIKMGTILNEILGIEFENEIDVLTLQKTLKRIDGFPVGEPNASGFWAYIILSPDGGPITAIADGDFADITIRNGDEVILVFTQDLDNDGLYAIEENLLRTFDTVFDSDGDGLGDFDEDRVGWDVSVAGKQTYHVTSDPAAANTDGDNWNDYVERNNGTDPVRPDTDGDGLNDDVDPAPLTAARRLYVDASKGPGGDGASWNTAYRYLLDAINVAKNAEGGSPNDDVSEIWVAQGVYKPNLSDSGSCTSNCIQRTFLLPARLNIYGGFLGTEIDLSERNSDPITNNTVLSGDVNGDDGDLPGGLSNRADNAATLLVMSSYVTIDGFSVERASEIAILSNGRTDITLSNLLIRQNTGSSAVQMASLSGNGHLIRNTTFTLNQSDSKGGALRALIASKITIEDCTFRQNFALTSGGAIWAENFGNSGADPHLTIKNSRFIENETQGNPMDISNTCPSSNGVSRGAAIYLASGAVADIISCSFIRNRSQRPGINSINNGTGFTSGDYNPTNPTLIAATNLMGGAGVCALGGSVLAVTNTEFFGNTAVAGAGIYGDSTSRLVSTNNSFVMNTNDDARECGGNGVSERFQGAGVLWFGPASITNTLFWRNNRPNDPVGTEPIIAQITLLDSDLTVVRNSFIQGLTSIFNGNLGSRDTADPFYDPLLESAISGNLQLTVDSPCIDRGDKIVDIDPITPGLQPLPGTDHRGNARVVDGNGDSIAEVDMGAHEVQP